MAHQTGCPSADQRKLRVRNLRHTHTHTQSTRPSVKLDCGSNTSQIVIAGSLKPWRKIQQRERVIHPSGVAPTLTATEYKDPTKVLVANGIYTTVSEDYQRGEIKDLSRTLLSNVHGAGVVIRETTDEQHSKDMGVVVNDEDKE